MEVVRGIDLRGPVRLALAAVVSTAPKETRVCVLVHAYIIVACRPHVFSRNHGWSRLWVLRLFRAYLRYTAVMVVVYISYRLEVLRFCASSSLRGRLFTRYVEMSWEGAVGGRSERVDEDS